MSLEQLIDTIMIHPSVTLSQSGRDTGFISTYSFQPLANLVYMRDQQITTAKGIVLGSLRSHQRQREVDLMDFVFHKLGAPSTSFSMSSSHPVDGTARGPMLMSGARCTPVSISRRRAYLDVSATMSSS